MDNLSRKLLFRQSNDVNLALARSIDAEHERILIRWARQYQFQALFPSYVNESGRTRCTCKAACVFPYHPIPGVVVKSSAEMADLLMVLPGLAHSLAWIMRDGSLQRVEFDKQWPPLAPTEQELRHTPAHLHLR